MDRASSGSIIKYIDSEIKDDGLKFGFETKNMVDEILKVHQFLHT